MEAEQATVTYCHNCQRNTLCHKYETWWICVARCWKHRKALAHEWKRGER